MRDVAIVEGQFDPGEEIDRFTHANLSAGAIVSFVGRVRPDGGVQKLELSHYSPLTQAGMEEIAAQARERWNLDAVLIRHRIGTLFPSEPIVLVAVSARHRRDAYQANDFLMDHLKSRAWFWKRELRSGGWHWIEPRAEDHADLARWNQQ